MHEGAPDKDTANAQPTLKAGLAVLRKRCAALRGRNSAAKNDLAPWPRDMNAADSDGAWGNDPAEVRGE